MLNVYLLSECFDTFDRESIAHAAKKYEYDFCKSLSEYANITVLTTKLQYPAQLTDGNVVLRGVAKGKRKYAAVREIVGKNEGKSVLIFWGYDLVKVVQMIKINAMRKIKCVPFIYDTHKIAIKNFSFLKKAFAEIYFSLGKALIRFFDGFIFFQNMAAKRLKVKDKPFIVIKPGVNKTNACSIKQQEDFLITYCGTLSELNGLDALLDSLKYFDSSNVKFAFCGRGPLLNKVIEAENKYDFVSFKGLLSGKDLDELYSESSLLLNLRRVDDEAMYYAFPSKIFECISSGIPVLTTKVLDDKEFVENTYILDAVTPENIADKIKFAIKDKENAGEKAKRAKSYIEEKYSFDKSARKVLDFINTL